MRLQNKVTLITGAGSGIGATTAKLFAKEGATVIVSDVSEENGKAVISEIEASGGKATFIKADVTKRDEIDQMTERVVSKYGQIDVLFNNAGVSVVGTLHETDDDLIDRAMEINVKGVCNVSKSVVPYMMEQKSGSIINMSSCLAEIGFLRRAIYAATKGAVLALTKSMQVDYAPYNIRVNAILPGTIYTPFVENYLKTAYDDPEKALKTIKQRQLNGKLGEPEDVANVALFLASDESSFMLGSPVYIDGGVVFGKAL